MEENSDKNAGAAAFLLMAPEVQVKMLESLIAAINSSLDADASREVQTTATTFIHTLVNSYAFRLAMHTFIAEKVKIDVQHDLNTNTVKFNLKVLL